MPIEYLRQFSGEQRSVAADRRLGRSLACIAGAVNAGGFLAIGAYTSHMTGMASAFADQMALGHFPAALAALAALLAFVLGAISSTLLLNWGRRRGLRSRYALALLLEALLLLLFGLLGAALARFTALLAPATVLLLCYIMGLQNAMITKLSRAEIRTTHLTGMLTDIGIELGRLLFQRSVGPESVQVDTAKLALHLSLVGSFCGGALIGAWAFQRVGYIATLPLACWLGLLASVPVADDIRQGWRQWRDRR
ncbi:YoaK family protein [Chitinimonas lacunae]|uniref:YoaK family protein n=1 Tax=Chitinimonas lacunae TaxID=1963018 RepID=A0ABV8MVB1_9NEIS